MILASAAMSGPAAIILSRVILTCAVGPAIAGRTTSLVIAHSVWRIVARWAGIVLGQLLLIGVGRFRRFGRLGYRLFDLDCFRHVNFGDIDVVRRVRRIELHGVIVARARDCLRADARNEQGSSQNKRTKHCSHWEPR